MRIDSFSKNKVIGSTKCKTFKLRLKNWDGDETAQREIEVAVEIVHDYYSLRDTDYDNFT